MAIATRARRSAAPIRNRYLPADEEVQAERERRAAARERLIPFCQYLWPGFQTRPYRELIAGALELVERREIMRLMVFCPSQYGKSELVSRNYIPWYMGRNPDDSQIICSYVGDLAYDLSLSARQHVESPAFRALFGNLSPYEMPVELSDERAAVKEWRLQYHRGRVKAAGVGGGVSGFPGDQVILDDPVRDDVDIMTPLAQDKMIRWFKGQVYGRLSTRGTIVITMTRWHENDLCGYLLREQENGGDQYHVLRLTALAESPAKVREWCERNFVPVERYITSEHLIPTGRGYS